MWWNFINICSTFTHSFTQFFCVLGGSGSVGRCAFLVFGHRYSVLVQFVGANPLIWADSAGWTSWEVLTVHDEWKMALVTVLGEVERLKMAVVCRSAGTVAHLE